jgi:hypothetical protein
MLLCAVIRAQSRTVDPREDATAVQLNKVIDWRILQASENNVELPIC